MHDPNDGEILLVEDNPADAEMTLRALAKHNLANQVVHVQDGAEALAFLFATEPYANRDSQRAPVVVLLDLKLPKVDGLEVLEKIKSSDATRTIPVVVLTSSREDRDLRRAYELGVNSYIVKPVEFNKFTDCIAQVGLYWRVVNRIPQPKDGKTR